MTTANIINIVLEMWGALFSLFLFFVVSIEKKISVNLQLNRTMLVLTIDCMLVLITDSLAIFFHGVPTPAAYMIVRITNFLTYLLQYGLALIYFHYLIIAIRQKTPEFHFLSRKFFIGLTMTYIFILILNIPYKFLYSFDINNTYRRGDGFWVTILMVAIVILAILGLFVKGYPYLTKLQRISSIIYFGLTIPCTVIQFMFYGLSLINMSFTFSIGIMFISHQITILDQFYKQQKELDDMRYALIDSQIRPHFLFNSLAIIRSLIRRDPDEAVDAINDLSLFIRSMLNATDKQGTCSIQEDLDIAKYYLAMEKRRFGDQLQVAIQDAQIIDESIQFDVPYFTIQPLVENAVRHGLRNKLGKGHIWINFLSDDHFNTIIISDDGIGFDQNITYRDDRSHIGIKNVKKRLALLCSGEMEIISAPKKGTVITLKIPQTN